jgi:hypothetical protein
MKRNLYVRFFNFAHEVKPAEKRLLIEGGVDGTRASLDDKYAEEVVEWLKTHPDGKVDFVWLRQ